MHPALKRETELAWAAGFFDGEGGSRVDLRENNEGLRTSNRDVMINLAIRNKTMGELADRLRPHVPEIQSAAEQGDRGAQQIISLYEMHRRCPSDPGAPALCAAALDNWLSSR